MIEFFQDLLRPELAFLRYALLIGIFAGPALGVIGTMVVTRRISSLAGASAHAALGGMGLALYLQRVWGLVWCTTTVGAVFGALGAALAVGIINLTAKEREDTAIGVVWALGMSIGLLFLDRTPGYVDWQGYLFGNILLLNPSDLYMTLVLDVLVLLPVIFFYRSILAVSFDSVFAKLRKVPVNTIYLGLLVLTSLVIVLLINVVGIILVIALLTLPAAAAGCLTRHLWSMMTLACVFSWLFVISGLIVSYCMHVPSGPAIVVIGSVIYLCCAGIAKRRRML